MGVNPNYQTFKTTVTVKIKVFYEQKETFKMFSRCRVFYKIIWGISKKSADVL